MGGWVYGFICLNNRRSSFFSSCFFYCAIEKRPLACSSSGVRGVCYKNRARPRRDAPPEALPSHSLLFLF